MATELRTDRWASLKCVAPAGGYSAADLVLVEDTVGIIMEDADESASAVLVYEAEKAIVPCAAAGAGDYPVGSRVAYDVSETGEVIQEDDMDRDNDLLCGIVLVQPDTAAKEVLIHLNGRMGRNPDVTSLSTDLSTAEGDIDDLETWQAALDGVVVREVNAEVSLAELNAGKTILAAATGYHYDVVGWRVVFDGACETATDVRISDTATSPEDVVTIAVAAATDNAIIGSHGVAIANVTAPDGPVTLGDDKGIQVRKTGSDAATMTKLTVSVLYKKVANS